MELLLNIAWICLGVSGLLWWRLERPARLQACGAGRAVVVLSVVWLLLFPVISMSDDLQVPVALYVSGNQVQDACKRLLKTCESGSVRQHLWAPATLLLSASAIPVLLAHWLRHSVIWLPARHEQYFRSVVGRRAPPAVFLLSVV